MSTMTVEQLYQHHIKSLSISERLRLVALITQELSALTFAESPRQRSLLELEGLGEEIWAGIDALEYVNELRKEWDHRP